MSSVRGISAAMAACGVLVVAQAQEPAPAERTESTSTAQSEPSSDGALQEVVVTAQFRSENLQETPLAITAVPAEELIARGFTNISQVGSTAPNVTLRLANATFGRTTQAYIRGVGQGDFNFASEPGVGMYVDDVYYSTLFGSVFDLLDLERVEVLRGPQGTLFGKNSIGGAVRLISKKPTGDNSGYLDATYGSFSRLDIRGGIDVPVIADKLFMRVSGVSKNREGYMAAYDFACAHPELAGTLPSQARSLPATENCQIGTFGGEDVQAARAALRFLANDRMEMNVSVDYLEDKSETQANKLIAVDPTQPNVARWNQQVNMANFGIPYDQRFITDSPFTTYATLSDPVRGTALPNLSGVEGWGVAGKVDYTLTETLSLKSITGYREYDGSFAYDQDGSPLSIQNLYSVLRHHQFSQELQLTGTLAEKLDYTFGGFYFRGGSYYGGIVQQNLVGAPGSGLPLAFNQNDRYKTQNESVFLHLVYGLTDRVNLIGGARYTDESKRYRFDHPPFLTVPDPQTVAYNRVDYRAGVDFDLTDDVMLYTQVSTGFRSGGFNARPFSAEQLVSYGPEEMTSYEVGAKTELFDRRLRFNVAGFYSDYKDRIVNFQQVDSVGRPFTRPANIGSATVEGVELEIEARPVGELRINGAFGLAKFEAPDLPGKKQAGVPERTASLGAQYTVDAGNIGAFTPRLDWAYQSEVYFDTNNTLPGLEPSFGVMNARITWQAPEPDWEVALLITNLTEERYFLNRNPRFAFGQGTVEGQPGRPREWGITVRRQF